MEVLLATCEKDLSASTETIRVGIVHLVQCVIACMRCKAGLHSSVRKLNIEDFAMML